MYYLVVSIAVALLFVFVPVFQNKVSGAVHVLSARLLEFSNAVRYLWPLALVLVVYLVADKVIAKMYP